jgi:hypothetical protein
VRQLIIFSAALTALIGFSTGVQAADKNEGTPAAKKTRELLKSKVNCDYNDTPTRDVLDDLEDQVKGLKIKTKRGDLNIKLNHSFTYSAKNITVADALDKLLGPLNWGYIVISQKGNAYDGIVEIRGESKERGYPADKDK